jgi:hypothetical protein
MKDAGTREETTGRRRGLGLAVHELLLVAVLIGSAAYTVGAGWRDLVGVAPMCQGERGLVTCITGDQPSGLSSYGTVYGVALWLAMLRWGQTSLSLRIVGRATITVGIGMFVADRIRGDRARALSSCYSSRRGECLGYFPALTLMQVALGLLVGAAVAFALIPPRPAGARASRTPAPA